MNDFVLIDVSNTFTKIAFSSRAQLGKIVRLPTKDLSAARLKGLLEKNPVKAGIAASVVPAKNRILTRGLSAFPLCWVNAKIDLGIAIDYPKPASIGADRLANAVAAQALYGTPAIVVDFGTAVTFDVVSENGTYVGGVIAPGLMSMTDYLHDRTALLPKVALREPRRAIGRSTQGAMLSGAVFGYRGLIAEIIRQIRQEISSSKKLHLVATGGDARLIAGQTKLFTVVSPTLTLEGLRLIANRNFPAL